MSSSIFHPGPINAAITSAVQQGISLVFFVADNGPQSSKWESVYLRSPEVLPLLKQESVLLRLRQGSTEAAFLAAFCPAQTVPYIVVIKNGALVANIPNDVASGEEFVRQMQSAFPAIKLESHSPSSAGPPSPVNPTAALFAERRARLEAQDGTRLAKEKEERDQRIARDKARRETESPARTKYVAEQRKIREDDLADRQRILRLVENDKIERRAKEERKQQAQRTRQYVRTKSPDSGPSSDETAISFRLLNGSILKGKFSSSSKLKDVRRWLNTNRTDEGLPFKFQQVIPNKLLSGSDENLTLADLSFAHATTLVLVHSDE